MDIIPTVHSVRLITEAYNVVNESHNFVHKMNSIVMKTIQTTSVIRLATLPLCAVLTVFHSS
jgi:hypothetical protein